MTITAEMLINQGNHYAQSFEAVSKQNDFSLLKVLKRRDLKPFLDKLATEVYTTAQERGDFCRALKHYYGEKLSKKAIAHFKRYDTETSISTSNISKPFTSLNEDQLNKLTSLLSSINNLQIKLLFNPIYQVYRDAKIETLKQTVIKNHDQVQSFIENNKELESQISKKGYVKILYWLEK